MHEAIYISLEETAMDETTMGGRIAARRRAKNLTQQQLADQLGVTNKAVSKWETDQGCPDIKTRPVQRPGAHRGPAAHRGPGSGPGPPDLLVLVREALGCHSVLPAWRGCGGNFRNSDL